MNFMKKAEKPTEKSSNENESSWNLIFGDNLLPNHSQSIQIKKPNKLKEKMYANARKSNLIKTLPQKKETNEEPENKTLNKKNKNYTLIRKK